MYLTFCFESTLHKLLFKLNDKFCTKNAYRIQFTIDKG